MISLSPPSALADLVSLVRASPAPVVFVDTCSNLDVIRSQHRPEIASALVAKSLRALEAMSAIPPAIHLVVAYESIAEYARNVLAVQQDASLFWRRLADSGGLLIPPPLLHTWTGSVTAFRSGLEVLADQLLASSHILDADAASVARASQRLSMGAAPARRASSNIGDCLIVEHLFSLVASLRNQGFGGTCIFVSSNAADFGRNSILKPPLEAEFLALRIEYVSNIEAAMVQVGL